MDYDALAKQFGGTVAPVDYDALARQFGGSVAAARPQPGVPRAVLPDGTLAGSNYYAPPPEEPPRTIGQRVMGTLAAPLDLALTLGSGAARGLAAPIYGLVTGRMEEGAKEVLSGIRQPQTPEARAMLEAAAPALQGLPPVIGVGLPQAMSAGPAAARQAGRAVGQEAALVQGAIEAPLAARRERQALQRSAADWARAPQIEAANRATELGIALNPAVSNPNVPNRIRSTLVGSRDINASLAAQNMPKWTELAKRDMELPAQTRLDAKAFEQARRQVSGPYEQLRRMGTLQASQDVLASLDNLRIEQAAIGGEAAAKRVNKLVDDAQAKLSAGLTGDQLLENIRQMRRDAQAIRDAQKAGQAPSPQKVAEADTKMRLANVLETVAEENIFDPRFLGAFREARAKMAKTYAYQDATDFNTGRVDPTAIAKLTQQDNALTGIIADIGAIAGNFPEIAVASTPANFAQQRLTRSGIMGTLGAGIGAVTPIGVIGGGVLGATAGEIYTGLRARKMGTPEYQQRFARPEDRRIFPPQTNELAPPTPGTPALYDWRNALLAEGEGPYRPNFVFGQPTPDVRVSPPGGPAQLPAPSAEATMAGLRAEDVRRAGISRAIGQEAEAAQAAAEAARPRPPTSGEMILDFDPVTGRLVPASRGMPGATPDILEATGKAAATAAEKARAGQFFAMTAEEKIQWAKSMLEGMPTAPGETVFRKLTTDEILNKIANRQGAADFIKKAREEAAAFEQLAARAKTAQERRNILAKREQMLDMLEALEEQFRAPRPQPSGGQGPKTREFQRNRLVEQQSKNRLIEP